MFPSATFVLYNYKEKVDSVKVKAKFVHKSNFWVKACAQCSYLNDVEYRINQ